MSLRIAVIGRTGQLARALIREGEEQGHEIIALGRDTLDLTDSPAVIESAVDQLPSGMDVLVIAAAYTDVDGAESDSKTAYAVNAAAPAAIARACRKHGLPLIHISTDYVFDGEGDLPYQPNDDTDPLGVYGASKLDGELAVLESGARAMILRTSWVFDGTGKNFLTTMLGLRDRAELRVVDDQIGRPTFAGHLASAVLKAADALVNDPELETNILHVTGGGEEASWADFAVEIFRAVEANVEVERIPSDDYPTIAERPLWSVLDSSAFERHFRHPMPDWRVGMNAALSEWQEARAND